MTNRIHTFVAWALGLGTLTFVLLLTGVGSGALTDDPPAVNPYATGDTTTTAPSADTTEAPGTTAVAAPEAAITIAGFAFGDPITVSTGTNVTVTNQDGGSHTWTSRDGMWDSGSLGNGGTFSFVFETAGSFEFFCSIHPSMTGSITVTE